MKSLVLTFVVAGGVMCAWIQPAEAIPPFRVQFMAKYVDGNSNKEFVDAVGKAQCNLCHKGAKKTDRNAYGEQLDMLLDMEDKADVEKIKKALDTVAEMKVNPDDPKSPTFGDLIKQGKLPGTEPAASKP